MSKVIVRRVGNNDNDTSELNDLFEQMTGAQNADPDILVPKLFKLADFLKKFIKLYNMFLNFDEFIKSFEECRGDFIDIELFISSITKMNERITDDIKTLSSDEINEFYNKMKDSPEIQKIIITSSNLKPHQRFLIDKNNLKDDFIKREPGLSFRPLMFTNLDLKALWTSDKITNMAKKYILNILSHTYLLGHEIYEIITSPNIDIKKFSQVLLSNIDKMKKAIPRCDKAFDIIKNSVEMLETNFKDYYKNSVESANPSVIIESFIVDVSLSQKSNAVITGQFRRIIMHMKKQAANNTDPRVKKLFKILNSQFDLMAKSTGIEPVPEDPEPHPSEDSTGSEPSD
jgi:hypothetical protein